MLAAKELEAAAAEFGSLGSTSTDDVIIVTKLAHDCALDLYDFLSVCLI